MGRWCRCGRRWTVLVLRNRKRGNGRQQGKSNVEPQADFRTRFNTQRHRTLLESRFAAVEVTGGFLGPREKNSTTQFANGHPHYPSSALRRTTLSKPVRGRNRFLTIEGSRGFPNSQFAHIQSGAGLLSPAATRLEFWRCLLHRVRPLDDRFQIFFPLAAPALIYSVHSGGT